MGAVRNSSFILEQARSYEMFVEAWGFQWTLFGSEGFEVKIVRVKRKLLQDNGPKMQSFVFLFVTTAKIPFIQSPASGQGVEKAFCMRFLTE